MSTALEAKVDGFIASANDFYLLWGGCLIFVMQCGFAMLEVGSVQFKNVKNILIKNVFDAAIGAIVWWILGFGVAMGTGETEIFSTTADGSEPNRFIGMESYATSGGFFRPATGINESTGYNWMMWFFQWTFAATAATIVSGAVAERITFGAYIMYAVTLIGFIYPIVVHWAWNAEGWASAWRETDLLFGCGVTDFAGSGVVHLTGGVAALCGATILGPRLNRFQNGKPVSIPEVSPVYQALGTLILWFGWYGFNCASTLYLNGFQNVAARVAVNTTIAAGTSCLVTSIIGKFSEGYISLTNANNGVLAGLVGITAGCSTVDPEGAFVIGFIAAPIYYFSNQLLLNLQIDDVISAVPVHGFCGIWGVFSTGLFATSDAYGRAYYSARQQKCAGAFYGGDGSMLGANIVFLLALIPWVAVLSSIVFFVAKFTVGLRVEASVEEAGMDSSKHGGISHQMANMDDIKLREGQKSPSSKLVKISPSGEENKMEEV